MKQIIKREEHKLQIYTSVNMRRSGRCSIILLFTRFWNAYIFAIFIFA